MSQEEARKLLDAWSFFDKHKEARSWEGMPRAEFYRLVQIIAGTDNLVQAKEYFEALAAGRVSGDMPTALLEDQKEGRDISGRLSSSRGAAKATRNWLAKLDIKSAEGVAEKQVAAAQVQAVVERVEEETPAPKIAEEIKAPEVRAPAPEVPVTTPAVTPPTPSEGGIEIKISSGALASFQQLAGKATATPLAVISLFSPPKSSMSPQASAAFSSALSISQIAKKAEGLKGSDREFVRSVVNELEKARFSSALQEQLEWRFFPERARAITILSGPEFGMDQGSIVALLGGGRGVSEKGPSFFARVGQQLFGGVAKKAVNKAISEGLTKAGISIGGKAAVAAGAEAAVGAAAGPPGWVVAALAIGKELLNRFVSWVSIQIREHGKEVVGGALLVAGFLIGGTAGLLVGVGGGLIALGGAGLQSVGTSIGSFLSFGFIDVLLPSIGIPLLIALLGIPALVVIILFIINSGAYLVPPSELALKSENPYISIDKVADPAGPFQNNSLPLKISYKITITPKKGTLTNIKITNTCKIIKEGSQPSCPAPEIPAPNEISPTSPFSFSYEETYAGSLYQDSLVIDTVSVTADAPEQKGTSTSGSVSLSIGTPPTKCLAIDGDWPSGFRANIESARGTLISNYGSYVAKVCSSYDKISLRFSRSGNGNYWGFNHRSYIDFYTPGVNSESNALYTLTHELGHSLIWGKETASVWFQYLGFEGINSEVPSCFYAYGGDINERLPEAIAFQVIQPRCGSVQSKYPIHYKFLKRFVFN